MTTTAATTAAATTAPLTEKDLLEVVQKLGKKKNTLSEDIEDIVDMLNNPVTLDIDELGDQLKTTNGNLKNIRSELRSLATPFMADEGISYQRLREHVVKVDKKKELQKVLYNLGVLLQKLAGTSKPESSVWASRGA